MGGAVSDNASTGGLMAFVDINNGIVVSDAKDYLGNKYDKHPESSKAFRGLKIERWEELMELVKKLAIMLPNIHVIGWDFALSQDKGWQIVEGNVKGLMSILQIPLEKGIRKDFERKCEWSKYILSK